MEERQFYTREEVLELCRDVPARKKHKKAGEIIWNGRGAAVWNAEAGVLAVPDVLLFLGAQTPAAVELQVLREADFGRFVVAPAELNPSAPSSVESVVFKLKLTGAYGRLASSFSELYNDIFTFGKDALREAAGKLEDPHRSRLLAFLLTEERTPQERWVVFRDGVFSGNYQSEDEAFIAANADRIRKRKSYRFWKSWMEFLDRGPSKAEILEKIHRSINGLSGYRSWSNFRYYEESLKLMLKDARKEVV
jgi:hypothetical protein